MTVEPGFGGQSFMSPMMAKVAALRKLEPNLNIQVDGGLNSETAIEAGAAGANMIVAGSSVFKADDIPGVIRTMREALNSHSTTPSGSDSDSARGGAQGVQEKEVSPQKVAKLSNDDE